MNPNLFITSAYVVSFEKLSKVGIDPKIFREITSISDQFALLILEVDSKSIRMISVDRERVTKVSIEATDATYQHLQEITLYLQQHELIHLFYSPLYLDQKSDLRVDAFLRKTDVSTLVHDLRKIKGVTKVMSQELYASK